MPVDYILLDLEILNSSQESLGFRTLQRVLIVLQDDMSEAFKDSWLNQFHYHNTLCKMDGIEFERC